jgi:DNA-binding NarL/FixJ family response regulator
MPQTVLIVDDHAGFRHAARALLEADGYTVVGEAATIGEAIAAVEREKPQIVLLDVELPDGNGFDLAERLTAGGARINVVLGSSRDYSDFAALVSRSGAKGFLPRTELSGARLAALVA